MHNTSKIFAERFTVILSAAFAINCTLYSSEKSALRGIADFAKVQAQQQIEERYTKEFKFPGGGYGSCTQSEYANYNNRLRAIKEAHNINVKNSLEQAASPFYVSTTLSHKKIGASDQLPLELANKAVEFLLPQVTTWEKLRNIVAPGLFFYVLSQEVFDDPRADSIPLRQSNAVIGVDDKHEEQIPLADKWFEVRVHSDKIQGAFSTEPTVIQQLQTDKEKVNDAINKIREQWKQKCRNAYLITLGKPQCEVPHSITKHWFRQMPAFDWKRLFSPSYGINRPVA